MNRDCDDNACGKGFKRPVFTMGRTLTLATDMTNYLNVLTGVMIVRERPGPQIGLART